MDEDRIRGRGQGLIGYVLGLVVLAVAVVAGLLWIGPKPAVPPDTRPVTPPVAQAPAALPVEVAESLPTLDLVRVDADGMALVAGRGLPGARLVVLIDGAEAMPIQADAKGQFATFVALAKGSNPQVLRLRMQGPDGQETESGEEIIVARPAAPAETAPSATTPAETGAGSVVTGGLPEPGQPVGPLPAATGSGAVVATGTPETVTAVVAGGAGASATADPAASETAAPTVLALGPEGPRVPAPVEGLSIDTVTYGDQGLQLAGRSEEAGTVRLYVDGRHAGDAQAGPGGDWRLTLPALSPGVHAARADRIDAAGRVTGRVELPFAADAGALTASEGGIGRTIVQPGESLWRIAERRYGKGDLYIRLYDANRGQIRDPDLIYPGQVFTMPE